ncbi:MAG: 5-oxoprolinase subunit PxpA [Alphaproteobacteria bacterium]|nr:5-oxoprolinase subunit PxpA [Alphaproteobacteria bacterium]
MPKVSINCDMGEAFGIYRMGDDEACLPYITHANVACGFHASDPRVMWRTVRAAKRHGVKVGSHPSLPDLQGFGRREMRLEPDEITAAIVYQTGALKGFLEAEGMALSHIKPHGALYGMAQRDPAVAEAVADAAAIFGVPVFAFANCAMSEVFRRRGIPFVCEFYADLDYNDEGRNIITREHHPVAPEDAAQRVRAAVTEGKTRAVSGKLVDVVAESVCVHSDTPGAIAIARAVREALGEWV